MCPAMMLYIVVNIVVIAVCRNIKKIFIAHMVMLYIIEVSTFDNIYFSIGGINFYLIRVEYLLSSIISIIVISYQKKIPRRLVSLSVLYLTLPVLSTICQFIIPYSGSVLPNGVGNWDDYLYGVADLGVWVFDWQQFLNMYTKYISFVLCVIAIKLIASDSDIYKIVYNIIKYFKYFLVYGVLEFFVKDVLRMPELMYRFTVPFLGIERCGQYGSVPVMRGIGYMLHGFTWEPSTYVLTLFMINILIILLYYINISNGQRYNNWKMFWILIFLMFVSTGFTVIWTAFILIVIYMYFNSKMSGFDTRRLTYIVLGFMAFISIGTIVILVFGENTYIFQKLTGTINVVSYFLEGNLKDIKIYLINGAGDGGSALVRFYSIIHCFMIFLDRPLFGLGLSSTWAYDTFVSTLIQIGLCGVVVWWFLVTHRRRESGSYDFKFFIIAIIFAGIPTGVLYNDGGMGHGICFVILMEAVSLIKLKAVQHKIQ